VTSESPGSPENRLKVLAHEVRSPVAAIVAIAESYPSANTARRRRLRELAAAAATSLERLLADAAPTSLRLERVDAGRLAREAADTAAVGGALVVADAQPGLYVNGDRDRLRQALDNLIGNAVGHSPEGGVVTVSAEREGLSVVIAVADEGEGIEPEDIPRVFEPGVRLTTERPGSGLGLALVREIARGHGGDVEVDSSPGQGSTFRLVLPAVSAAG
jgi:two-component system sensor histidine kinase BaeS